MCLTLLGCTSTENTHNALGRLIGSSEERVVAVVGIPNAVYHVGDTKFIMYKRKGYIYFLDGHTIASYCKITFHIKNGIISDYMLEGQCET